MSYNLDQLGTTYSTKAGMLDARFTSRYTWRMIERRIVGENILVFGLGNGYIVEQLCACSRFKVVVLEGSKDLIDRFPCADLCEIRHVMFEDFDHDRLYDSVIATHVLEHVEDPKKFLQIAHSALNVGGRAFFTVPNAMSIHRLIGVKLGVIEDETDLGAADISIGHRRVFDQQEFWDLLRSSRFDITHRQGYMLKVVPNSMMAEWSDILIDAIYEVSKDLPIPMSLCSNLLAVCKIKLGVGK